MSATRRNSKSTAAGSEKTPRVGSNTTGRAQEFPRLSSPFWKRPACDFSARERLEPLRDFGEPLFPGGPGKAGVLLRVLVGLPFDGGVQVGVRGAHREAGGPLSDLLQEIEMPERVAVSASAVSRKRPPMSG